MSHDSAAVLTVIAILLGVITGFLLPEAKGKESLLCNFETGEAWHHETYWLGDYRLKRVSAADTICKSVCRERK